MLEVEVKLGLMVPGALRDRLAAAGAVAQPTQNQTDVYFQHADRDLAVTDEALRLRKVNDALELTYKGPRQGGDAKVRVEENVGLSEDPTTLLGHLGWTPAATLRKVRESWSLEDLSVCIDKIDGLGTFAEVELLAEDAAAATEKVEDAVKALGLVGAERYSASYLEMAQMAGLDLS